MRWSAVSSLFTGKKVPAPTWRVRKCNPTPAVPQAVEQIGREVEPGGGGSDGALVAGIDGLVVGAVLRVLRPLRGDVGRKRDVADAGDGLVEIGAGKFELQHDAVVVLGDDGGVDAGEKAGLGRLAEADEVAFACNFFAPLTKASQRLSARRRWRVAEIEAACPARSRRPSSWAGMTRVSLNTRASPGLRMSGRSRTIRSSIAPPGATTISRAASRGLSGRSAMRSAGRSKSKRSTRMAAGGSGGNENGARIAPGAASPSTGDQSLATTSP
jgi:hypothetical protein